jgi:hypothetical protein
LAKRYLFTTGEKKIACAVGNRAYCAWAVLFSGKLGLAVFLSLKVYGRVSVVTPYLFNWKDIFSASTKRLWIRAQNTYIPGLNYLISKDE